MCLRSNKNVVIKNVSLFTLQGSTPTKEAIDKSNDFPHIVMFVDEELPSSFFIAIDKQLVVQCAIYSSESNFLPSDSALCFQLLLPQEG